MNLLRKISQRVSALFGKQKLDAEMAEEMRHHLERRTQANLAAGMSADEARFAAQRQFGGVDQLKEIAREQRGWLWLEQSGQDLRYAMRQLAKSPGFTVIVVLSLALGIGANTAIFTVVDALMLRALPVREPQRLVILGGDGTYARFEQLRGEITSLSGLFAVGHIVSRRIVVTGSGTGETESALAQEVSGNFFSVLVEPAQIGRPLVVDDDKPGAARPVAVLSHAFWHRRFAGDPAVLGRTITVSNVAVTIVGVMPAGFFGVDAGQGRAVDLWCPLWLKQQLDDGFEAQRLTTYAAGSSWLSIMGRLQPGVSLEQARAELAAVCQRAGSLRPNDRAPQLTLELGETGFSRLRGQFHQPINVLWTITGLVLLVACANVGGLLLARGATRQREFAVRLAMGASRGRIARQLVTESLLLALLGGGVGLLLASWGVTWLARYLPGSVLDLGVNLRVLLFTTAVAAISGVFFGLAPAWRFSRLDLTAAFKLSAAALAGSSRLRINAVLVIAQIALSFLLLAGAGLFVQTLQNLRTHDPGFARENVLQFVLDFGRAQTDAQRAEAYRRALAEIETLPGVRSATISTGGLLGSTNSFNSFSIDGVEVAAANGRGAAVLTGSRHYFETKGMSLIRGRDFIAADEQPGAPRVAVISESIARKYFPGTDPIGRQIGRAPDRLYEIIGVAHDAQVRGVREPAGAAVYLSYFQEPDRWMQQAELCVRTTIDPIALAQGLRHAVKKIDPETEPTGFGTVTQLLERRFVRERTLAELSGFFSSLTLLLAGVGLYGLLAGDVTQRTREIGVRIALGAQVRDVLALVIGQGVRLAIIGCVLGMAGAAALTQFVVSMLYGVEGNDPRVLGSAVLLVFGSALLACWLPARRATRVGPMVALRCE